MQHVSTYNRHLQAKLRTVNALQGGCAQPHCIRRTPSQLHSLQQIPTQHDMLPQHLVYKNELNREYVVTLARNDEIPWWWSEKIETCRSGFKCFKWRLHRCIFWLIFEVILRNARCNDEIHNSVHIYHEVTTENIQLLGKRPKSRCLTNILPELT